MTDHADTHVSEDDPRNETILIWVDGRLLPRAEATVSVYDSGFMMGDGVWEGLRLHDGTWAFLDEHLDRLFEAAKAIDLTIPPVPFIIFIAFVCCDCYDCSHTWCIANCLK